MAPVENCPSTMHLGPDPLPDAVVGEYYDVNILDYTEWGGGVGQSTQAELPAGLEFVGDQQIIGTPAEAGTYEVVISVVSHTAPLHCSNEPSTHTLTLLVHEAGGETSTGSSTSTGGTSTAGSGSSG